MVIRNEGAVNPLVFVSSSNSSRACVAKEPYGWAWHAHNPCSVIEQVANSGMPLDARRSTPHGKPRMELMMQDGQRKQRVHVEQIFHGNSARSSPICSQLGYIGPCAENRHAGSWSSMIEAGDGWGRWLRAARTSRLCDSRANEGGTPSRPQCPARLHFLAGFAAPPSEE